MSPFVPEAIVLTPQVTFVPFVFGYPFLSPLSGQERGQWLGGSRATREAIQGDGRSVDIKCNALLKPVLPNQQLIAPKLVTLQSPKQRADRCAFKKKPLGGALVRLS